MGTVDNCSHLEKTLRDGIVFASRNIADKYGTMRMDLNVPTAAKQIFNRLESLEDNAVISQTELYTILENSEKENPDQIEELRQQIGKCDKLLEFVQCMRKIEGKLIILRSKCDENSEWGSAIIECKSHLQEISVLAKEMNLQDLNLEEPLKHFGAEFSHLNYQCRYFLSAEYDHNFKLPKVSNRVKQDRSSLMMTIRKTSNPGDLNKINHTLTAMSMIGQLAERLQTWKILILDVFCDAIANSRDGQNVYRLDTGIQDVSTFKLLTRVKSSGSQTMNVDGVLTTMERFFTDLADALNSYELLDATGKALISTIGCDIEEPLIKMILQDIIALAAPVSEVQEDEKLFIEVMNRGEKFVEHMRNLKFFSPSAKLFDSAHIDNSSLFVNRRCFAIVKKAQELIEQSYEKTCKVGGSGEIIQDENTFSQISKNLASQAKDENLIKNILKNGGDGTFPPIFVMQQCCVSESAVKFVELLKDTVRAAFETEDEMAQSRLSLTAQNIVRLYLIQSTRKHANLIQSIPSVAALFYNNCYYISHSIMTLSFEINSDKKAKKSLLEPLLIDSIGRLRNAAAESLENTLLRCRRDLALFLDDPRAFEYFPKGYTTPKNVLNFNESSNVNIKEQPKLVQSLGACLLHIRSMSNSLREIMPEVVYCKSIGSLVTFLLESLIKHVISTSDIRENDAYAITDIFKSVIEAVDSIMTFRGRSQATDFCSEQYFRLHEIIFVLGNRMQDIEMRWFNGKGPMAEHLTEQEVIGLIKALFADSQQRKDLIARL